MNTRYINKVALIASMAIVLSACFGGSSSGTFNTGTINTGTEENSESGSPLIQSAFAFPDVQLSDGINVGSVVAPEGPLPEFSARRTLLAGSGDVVAFGDPVQLKYNMYSWTTGELIETTDDFDEAVIISAGVAEGVPAFLSNTVLGRNKGETVQIVYEAGLEDLPGYLDNNDAYIMVLQVL